MQKTEKNCEFDIFDNKTPENHTFSLNSPILNSKNEENPEKPLNNSSKFSSFLPSKIEEVKKSSNPFEELLPNNHNSLEKPLEIFSNFNEIKQLSVSKNLTNYFMNTQEKTLEKPFEFVDNLMKIEENPFSLFSSLKFPDSSKKTLKNDVKNFDLL